MKRSTFDLLIVSSNPGLAIFFLFFPPKMRQKVNLGLSNIWWVYYQSKVRTSDFNISYQSLKIRINKDTISISVFKIDLTKMLLIFLIFYSLVPKTAICLKYFLDEIFQKHLLCSLSSQFSPHSTVVVICFGAHHDIQQCIAQWSSLE